ncbi:MAG: hypothetical protein H7Z72_01830 [Bacteroidetes bacterium]|nr:hypothetical protein [Fibrella sp.]
MLWLILAAPTGCRQKPAKATETEVTTTQSDTTPAEANAVANSITPAQTSELAYANEDAKMDIRVLGTGPFHDDEVWPTAAKEGWFGLFIGKDGYYIARTKIATEHVYDPVVDEDTTDRTGWQINVLHPGTAVFLIAEKARLREGLVRNSLPDNEEIAPGQQRAFTCGGQTFKLIATGRKTPVPSAPPGEYAVEDYRLYLEGMSGNTKITQLIVAESSFEEATITILFVGDLDGDALPDLIIDTTNHYNMVRPTLYLSKSAPAGKLVKLAGWYRAVGC